MKITNKYDLPNAFVEMAKSEYKVKPKEYRVTSLLKGVKETLLERRHFNEIEVDVVDMIWALWGQAAHHVLENQKLQDGEERERRIKIPVGDGYTISGQFDLFDYNKKKLTDYKTTSVWKVIYGDYDDWRNQLLIYAYLLRQEDIDVECGEITAILRDHKKSEAKRKKDYPKVPVKKVNFEFSPQDLEYIERWIYDRIRYIKECEALEDDNIPACTQEERWNNGDKYAVKQEKKKKALRVLDSYEEAESWAEHSGKEDLWIEIREGEDTKCIDYCLVNRFCNYYLQKYVYKKTG